MKIVDTTAIAATVLFLTNPVLACSFKVKGVTPTNQSSVKSALQTIQSDVEFNEAKGEVHFTGKDEVSEDQVKAALAQVEGVTVVQEKHGNHKKKK